MLINPKAGDLIRYDVDRTFVHRSELAWDVALILEAGPTHIRIRWMKHEFDMLITDDQYEDFERVDDV